MKYAFIALIAIYLVIYGCSPDKSEKAVDSHEQTALTVSENSPKSEEVVAPVVQHEPADATQQSEKIVTDDTSKQAPTVVEEGKPPEVADKTDPIVAFKVVEQAPGTVEEKVVSEAQPVTEEGKPAVVADKTDPILSFKVVEQNPGEQAVEPEQVVLPCGRIVARADIPENAPCLNMQPQGTQDTAVTSGNEQELTTALQKMVDTTNDMVLATRQLVIATQELLDANKKADEKTQPAQQETEGQAPAPSQQ